MEAVTSRAVGFETERLLLEDIIRSVVDRPERVAVKPIISTQVCLFEIYVDPFDCRRVIGKRGRSANALRELLLCWQGKREGGERFILEIIEPELMLETLEASGADRSLGTEPTK